MEFLKFILCASVILALLTWSEPGGEKPRFLLLGWLKRGLQWLFIGSAVGGFILGVLLFVLGILFLPLWLYILIVE